MKRISAASIVGIGAVLALGMAASANAAQAPQGVSKVVPTVGVTADIRFDINYAVDAPDAPLYSERIGVEVNDSVELPSADEYYEDAEGAFCSLPSIDIAADLSSVTVTGYDDQCGVQVANLEITLHGGQFGAVTLGSDQLFSLFEVPEVGLQGSGGGGGGGGLPGALRFALVEIPTVQTFATSGAGFNANWTGTGRGVMTGVSVFNFAVGADGAQPVPADPNFTG